MSTFLWGALIFMSVGSVAAIVIAIIGTIENDNRRFGVIMSVTSIAMVTLAACVIFVLMHKKIEVREALDVVPPVQIEPRGAPEASA